MGLLSLLAALVLTDGEVPPTAAPPPRTVVTVREVLEPGGDRGAALELEALLQALRARLAAAPVELRVGEDAAPESWQLMLVSRRDGNVEAWISTPEGEIAARRTLRADRAHPGELVHTIVLLVTEALRPILDGLREVPEIGATDPGAVAPTPPEPAWRASLNAGVALLPKAAPAASAGLERFNGRWGAGLWLGWAGPVKVSAAELELGLGRISLDGLALVRGRWGADWLLGAGPSLELRRLWTSGRDVELDSRTSLHWGAAVCAAATLDLGWASIGLRADGSYHARPQRYWADGRVLATAGPYSGGLGLLAARSF